METLITGAFGRVGTAIIEHLGGSDDYDFTYLDTATHPDHDSVETDVSDLDSLIEATESMDAVIHLAVFPDSWSGPMEGIVDTNIVGTFNVVEACRQNKVETVILASSHHVMGMYEEEHAPDLYKLDSEMMLDHRDPVRPDSRYAASKLFGEAIGRYYAERPGYPERVYALRLCSVRGPEHDHPYSDAERAVADGSIRRGSEAYQTKVMRMKAMWHSRRDVAHLFDCCLQNSEVTFDIFYGVSDNDRRWFDLSHARERIGYAPSDNGEAFTSPPS